MDKIIVRGAREHNLKNITVEIPRNKMVVMTGISGSGKSSLAFDTIYAEGQRRYVESLSAYARQFLGDLDKPDVDHIDGLSPAISIDQKSTSKNPRSTVGTITEIYDYLRVLYARAGTPHCPNCGKVINQQTSQQIIEQVLNMPEDAKFMILSPLVKGKKGEHKDILAKLKKQGFARVRIDGLMYHLDDDKIELEKNKRHDIEVVVDRLVMADGIKRRVADSVETALNISEGTAIIVEGDREETFSQAFACVDCGISLPEIAPRMFSFNSPYGACKTCSGLGTRQEVDESLLVPEPELSLEEGAVAAWNMSADGIYSRMLTSLSSEYGISMETPWNDLPDEHKEIILHGSDRRIPVKFDGHEGYKVYNVRFEGIVNNLMRRFNETNSDHARERISQYIVNRPCPACHGARLRPESLAVTVGGENIHEVVGLSIEKALDFLTSIDFSEREKKISSRLLKEINERLKFLSDVGLDYLTLDRSATTLSGGEAQRIRLATQIGSSLMGVLYVLDEPSIGLHPRDNNRLITMLHKLRDLGNTLIVVEHDEETIRMSDYVIDIGPEAGEGGGRVVAQGTVDEFINHKNGSITADYLAGRLKIEVPKQRMEPSKGFLTIKGAAEHNLKNIDVEIPLGVLTAITGVSGSGKSTLICDILYPALSRKLYRVSTAVPGKHKAIEGIEQIDKVIDVSQSPIGRTPRSNPATYTGMFDKIRNLFAETVEAKQRGYAPGRFSFNVRGGRCEACRGEGLTKIEMHFLPDVYIACDICKGKRFNEETLEVKFKGYNISDVLNMSVDKAARVFEKLHPIKRHLDTMIDVGLGYIKLGQPATTLSGGEAQRIKLSSELSKRSTGRTLYILDEPTTGLHFADTDKLISVLQRLVQAGNSVVVIEHNLDVIKVADWVIDMGPEGGDKGGEVICCGSPEIIAKDPGSYTGHFLKPLLDS